MTSEELAKFNGQDGQPVYVAVNNIIYDLSGSSLWENGNHVNAHQAGQDLTEDIKKAPHVKAVVERFPVVGKLEKPPEKKKKALRPFLRTSIVHHLHSLSPHPLATPNTRDKMKFN